MRNLIILLAISCLAISACQSESKNTTDDTLTDTATIAGKSAAIELETDNPVLIDSSESVMYPLANKQTDDDDNYFIRKSRADSKTYWNIIFYNSATKKSHLLSGDKKMIILSYNQNYDSYSSGKDYQTINLTQTKGYILYSIISSDYNRDKRLNDHDPTYLFISDKEGNNFKQISPDNEEVLSWQLIEKTGKILFSTLVDSNRDKVFDEKDKTVPYAYDVKTGKSAEKIFTSDFNEMVDKLHKSQWPIKKK